MKPLKVEAKKVKSQLEYLFPSKQCSEDVIFQNLKANGPTFVKLNRIMLAEICKYAREYNLAQQ